MSERFDDQIRLFRTQIRSQRFNVETLRLLESLLVSRNLKCYLDIRSSLKELLHVESLSALKHIDGETVDHKLALVGFFVAAFALVGDAESCLALKYEALLLRETECRTWPSLHVDCDEWLTFAEDSLQSGFYAIAVKGYENALQCIQPVVSEIKPGSCSSSANLQEKILNLRDKARHMHASHSVQAITADYLRKKARQQITVDSFCLSDAETVASGMFRSVIKKRNSLMLQKSQSLQKADGRFRLA